MDEITKTVKEVRAAHQWIADPEAALGIEFDFWFPTRRPDYDGPLKRTQDAVMAGLDLDDNRIDEALIHRWIGEPAIGVRIWELPANRDPNARTVKKKSSTPQWVSNQS